MGPPQLEGAVPLFVSWRNQGMSESNLLEIVEHIAKVPELEIEREVESIPLSTTVTITKSLSPEAFVKFYLHLEKVKKEHPDQRFVFSTGGKALTYQAVMNQLEQGTYNPSGETDDVIEHLKGINEHKSQGFSQFTSHITTTKYIEWDHKHFKSKTPKVGN